MEPITVTENALRADTPRPPLTGMLKTERNRWFAACLSLSLAVTVSVMFAWHSYTTATNNFQILYVKLQPNGMWNVEPYNANDPQLFFKTTVDALLANYVRDRYGIEPATIANDWGRAQTLMDDDLAADFIAKKGFNAIEKAAAIAKAPNQKVAITWRFNDHYDSYINPQANQVMRTNIYFTETPRVNGIKGTPVKKTLLVKWYLKSKEDLKHQSNSYIIVNPLNLKILSETLTYEPTGDKS
jgi:hypothetical protein